MATQTPTTQELSDNIVGSFEAQLGQTVPLLPKAFIRVLAKVMAATFITLYKYVSFVNLQLFVSTASDSPTELNGQIVTPLIEWGRLIGVGDPQAATAAELEIQVTVENQTGTLPTGSQLLGAINGVTYVTLGDVLLDAPTIAVDVRAVADPNGTGGVGTLGNLSSGDVLNFANPLANVARQTTVIQQNVTGADAETTDSYRQRVIDRFQRRPQGGAYADYAIWGEEVEGIARVYPYTGVPGEVDVYVESATEDDGVPTSAQLTAVFESIEMNDNGLADRRPANALVNTLPVSSSQYVVTVTGLETPNEVQVQADVESALDEYFRQARPFIVGLDVLPRRDAITAVEISAIVNDVVKADGGYFVSASVTLYPFTTPLPVVNLGEGDIARLREVDFI